MKACVLLALLSCGCLRDSVVYCGNDIICAPGHVCTANGGCALPDQLAACDGLIDGATCTFVGGVGTCTGGVCVGSLCGNGAMDPGEVCDPGSSTSQCFEGGCRDDCLKTEMCGDGVTDCGEQCDDLNANPAAGCDACKLVTWKPFAVVGGNTPATSAELKLARRLALDKTGNLFISDTNQFRVFRVDAATKVITPVAGTGQGGLSGPGTGDGGPATAAPLAFPQGLAVDGLGNVFIADTLSVRRVDAETGVITTILTPSEQVAGVAVDGLGNVYAAAGSRLLRIDAGTGAVTTAAGTGTVGFSGDNGPPTSANIGASDVALDSAGRIFIAAGTRIRVIEPDAQGNPIIRTYAGGGLSGRGDDGLATLARFFELTSIALDAADNLYITDSRDDRIRRVDAVTKVVTTFAGTTDGFAGDSGPATAAKLHDPEGVAAGADGVYIADTFNRRVRRVDANGTITTFAGSATPLLRAASTRMAPPSGMAADGAGNIYAGFFAQVVRITPSGDLTVVAGTGVEGYSGDGGPATEATMGFFVRVAADATGNVFIADMRNQVIRRVDAASGVITTFAGNGSIGFGGDGGPATAAALNLSDQSLFSDCGGVAVDGAGNVYIADGNNSAVRRVDKVTNIITTVAGNNQFGSDGDGGPALGASMIPDGVALDSAGNLYIADIGAPAVRRVDAATGIITTLVAVEVPLRSVFVDGSDNVYASSGSRVQRRTASGNVETIAGTALAAGYSGDGGLATSALLRSPIVAVASSGDVYIGDAIDLPANVGVIRRVGATGTITSIGGLIEPDGAGPLAARLADPRAYVSAPAFALVAGGTSGTVELLRGTSVDVVAGRHPQAIATANLARYRTNLFGDVGGVAYDAASGVAYVTESTGGNCVQEIATAAGTDPNTWTMAPLGGAPCVEGFRDGATSAALFRRPGGVHLAEQTLLVADTGNHVIRAVDLAGGQTMTVAGTPQTLGYFGDDGPATDGLLFRPAAVTQCPNGDIFVADTGNRRVRRIAKANRHISTVLGDGSAASSGEGTPAKTFAVDTPLGIACDGFGNVYVTSRNTVRLLPADKDGEVDGEGPVQTIYGKPPRDAFPASVTRCLTGIAVVDGATVRVTDSCTGIVVELRRGAP